MRRRKLNLCVDMFGCPNRCRHCWLGHFEHRPMEDGADEYIVDLFRPYFDEIAFYSWLREPDFTPDYATRWERDKALSVGCEPERFELASFYRLCRDENYVHFLKAVGTKKVQLTFFGMVALTDKYVGRKGAFGELTTAAKILIEHGIAPRYQVFINSENVGEIEELIEYLRSMHGKMHCEFPFELFIHEGSCDGENRKLYDIRINKSDIPENLRRYHLDYENLLTERECCELLKDELSHHVHTNGDTVTLYVTSDYDVYFNFTNLTENHRIGNLKFEPIDSLMRRIRGEDTFALNAARELTLARLVELYGDFTSEKAFYLDDYKDYLVNNYIESK